MLNNWEDINKLSRQTYDKKKEDLPLAMFDNIQKKLFWNNIKLYIIANYIKASLYLISAAFIIIAILFISNIIADKQQPQISNNNNFKVLDSSCSEIKINEKKKPYNKADITTTSEIIKKTNKTINIIHNKTYSPPKVINSEDNNNIRTENNKSDVQNYNQFRDYSKTISIKNQEVDLEKSNNYNLQSIASINVNQLPSIKNFQIYPISRIYKNDYYKKESIRNLSLKLYASPFMSFGSRKNSVNSNETGKSNSQNNSEVSYSASFGLALEKKINDIHIQVGIQYTMLDMKYAENNLLYNSQKQYYNVLSGHTPQIEEHSYYHNTYMLDSIIHIINSEFVTTTDTNYIPIYDNYLRYVYDTLKSAQWKETFNLIEIPLTIGYGRMFKSLECMINFGLVFGYTSSTKYNAYAGLESDMAFVSVKNFYNNKSLQLGGIISLAGIYWTNEHIGIEVSPYYRRNLLKIFSSDKKTSFDYNIFGINFGLIYKL